MSIIKQKAECMTVDCLCDTCGEGRMRPNGVVLQTDYPTYEHECNKCGVKELYGHIYPYPTFE